MFTLRDLPSRKTIDDFAARYGNPDAEGLETWLVWASATSEMLSAFERNLQRTCGISQTQLFVLILLKRNPDGLGIGALASRVSVTSQTMTRVVDRMERDGLCRREPDPQDRRAQLVQLTAEGDRMLEVALPFHYQWVADLMSCLDTTERATLRDLVSKLDASRRTRTERETTPPGRQETDPQ
ncbi:MarR family transcriptional regulator [Phaeovibrio sulfidiphilus]|uniref:MarR family transcriptional regulator n=1 Tax=Phaeovibrio sulfidiphilus TaxID=1220600 RepID=A0A8J6YNW9_9PROT|nr:MarR family transcriptional regulator [Phaeovibrio sulfidiphilus]MBE1237254.1 MarR family transcriptional regulator [Phaeovibrio sulfidiphilus]